MKFKSVILFVAVPVLFAACNSLDNPLSGLFGHHHNNDARVYNPQTGEWEWPNQKTTPAPQKSAAVASTLSATPPPHGFHDTRTYDAQKNQWVEQHNAGGPSTTPAPKAPAATPAPAPAAATASSEAPAASTFTPAPPRPGRATGTYNASTGKIDWQTSPGAMTAAATPPPKTKHWWWPF